MRLRGVVVVDAALHRAGREESLSPGMLAEKTTGIRGSFHALICTSLITPISKIPRVDH